MAAAKLAGRPVVWQHLCLPKSRAGASLGTQFASDNLMEQLASIDYRRAVLADAPAIAEVHRQAHRETYVPLVGAADYKPPSIEAKLAQWTQALSGPGIAYVAIDASRAIGFTHALGDRITTLYILEAYHRRGIGRGLLSRLRGALSEIGIAKAGFAVLALNTKAIAFYRARGAHPLGSVMVEEFGSVYQDLLFEIATGGACN
jgi:ribosomal protein S18 acetylase RimI-like enzyme